LSFLSKHENNAIIITV